MLTALRAEQEAIGFESLQYDDQIGKLAVVGAGMRTSAGVSAQLFRCLSDNGHQHRDDLDLRDPHLGRDSRRPAADALQVVHTAFGLDGDDEAVVHAGTGR